MVELIAEIGINHNGDLGIAQRLIDVAAGAGCHFVKFQKRDVNVVYTPEELDTPRESPWGISNRQQKEGLEFSHQDYQDINRYCSTKGIRWLASPWDLNSLAFLEEFYPPFIKVPSALITNERYLKAVRDTGIPVILSTGMSDMKMIDKAVAILGKQNIHCIMHCTSTYPSKTEELNLRCIQTLKNKYPWAKIGFSNHHPGLVFLAAAVALGAEMLEFHITLDRAMYGSDQAASIEPEGVFKLSKWSKSIDIAMGDGKKIIYESERPIIAKLRR